MAITKKLSRVGTSYSLIIDKSIMGLLGITPDTELEITMENKSLVVTPKNADKPDETVEKLRKEKVQEAFRSSLNQYGEVYKKLSDA